MSTPVVPAHTPTTPAELGRALAITLAIVVPFVGFGSFRIYGDWSADRADRLEKQAQALAWERVVAAAPQGVLPVDAASHGRDVFVNVCAACHGEQGLGVPSLGKNLVTSDFVAGQNDDQMVAFLHVGRMDAKVPMPPKGGRDDLTDKDLSDLVVYLRGLQDPRRLPELPPVRMLATAAPTADEQAAALAAAGGDPELAAWIASGSKLFAATCAACHGKDAKGMPGSGKDLTTSAFIQGLDDDALLAFLMKGRDPGDPANTTGVGMPPKGGNPALSEDDLLDIIAYARSIQKKPG